MLARGRVLSNVDSLPRAPRAQQAAAKVYGTLEASGQNDVAARVDRDCVTTVGTGRSEAPRPHMLAGRGVPGKADVLRAATCACECPPSEIDRTPEPARDEHVATWANRHTGSGPAPQGARECARPQVAPVDSRVFHDEDVARSRDWSAAKI